MFFFFFTRPNEGARKIGRVSDVLRAPARPIGTERAVCPGLYYQIKVILSYVIGIYIYFIYFQQVQQWLWKKARNSSVDL